MLLVGEDSLEANVGYLAALTGGDIFVASGERVDEALRAAMTSLREAPGIARVGEVRRSGAVIAWRRAADAPHEREPMNDALVALAVGLEIRDMPEEQAAELAERHGLVTHLTSLLLVDEAGEMQKGLPALRKVALPSPATPLLAMRSASSAHDIGFRHRRPDSPRGASYMATAPGERQPQVEMPPIQRKVYVSSHRANHWPQAEIGERTDPHG